MSGKRALPSSRPAVCVNISRHIVIGMPHPAAQGFADALLQLPLRKSPCDEVPRPGDP